MDGRTRETTIRVTDRWNRRHLSWIFSEFHTFTLHTFVLNQMHPSPSPMLSHAYFGALKWLQIPNQHWGGENRTSVSRFLTSIVASLTSPEIWASATSKAWRDSSRAVLSPYHSRRQNETLFAGCLGASSLRRKKDCDVIEYSFKTVKGGTIW